MGKLSWYIDDRGSDLFPDRFTPPTAEWEISWVICFCQSDSKGTTSRFPAENNWQHSWQLLHRSTRYHDSRYHGIRYHDIRYHDNAQIPFMESVQTAHPLHTYQVSFSCFVYWPGFAEMGLLRLSVSVTHGLLISMTEQLSGVLQVPLRCPVRSVADIGVLSLSLSASQGASLGDFLHAPAYP